jgi:L-alanine-DL-glutamate epimerase-like enolase superfamily enzyme
MKIIALETLRTDEFSNVLWARVHTDASASAESLLESGINSAESLLESGINSAESLLESGIKGMKIRPFDPMAIENNGLFITAEQLKAAIEPFEKIRKAVGDRPDLYERPDLHVRRSTL